MCWMMCGRSASRLVEMSRFAPLASPLLDCADRRIFTAIGIATAVAVRLEKEARIRSLFIRLIQMRECLFVRLISHDASHEHESRERVG